MKDLTGRVAVVTGGGGGIGEALAVACARAGMKVVTCDIEAAGAERVAASIRDSGGRAIGLRTDVSKRSEVEALADAAYGEFGGCHLLCNNAGVMVRGPIVDSSDEDWSWVLGVNLYGVLHGIRAFVPRMRASGEPGHIVNTASVAGLTALPDIGVYSASKYAVMAISEAMASELEGAGIGVSVLCPGGVATRITESERNRPDSLGGAPKSAARSVIEQAQEQDGGMNEVLQPAEVAELTLAAVRAGDLYVTTHPAWREAAAGRFDAIALSYARAEERRKLT